MIPDLEKATIKVKVVEEAKLKAIISVDFDGLVVKGFRIQNSEFANEQGENLWLVPPSYRDGGGRYHPIFYLTDKEAWKRLEKIIFEEYRLQRTEHFKKRLDLSDDDIPIVNF